MSDPVIIGNATLYHGDCLEVMRQLPDNSVDAVVTSPPYAMQRAKLYGGVPEDEYPSWTVAWMEQVRRILKPHGSVLINIREHIRNGEMSAYVHRTRLALREAGWIQCDELIWVKPDAPPVGHPGRPRRSWERILWFAKGNQPWCDPKANGRRSRSITTLLAAVQEGFSCIGVEKEPEYCEIIRQRMQEAVQVALPMDA